MQGPPGLPHGSPGPVEASDWLRLGCVSYSDLP